MELIFIYNAESGTVNALIDFTHKIISPSTYDCQLCSITHGIFGMKQRWKTFLDSLPYKKTFLHKDEVQKTSIVLPKELPAILLKDRHGEIKQLVSSANLIGFQSMNELIQIIHEKLKDYAKNQSN